MRVSGLLLCGAETLGSDVAIEKHLAKLIGQHDQTRRAVANGNFVPFWMLLYLPLDKVRKILPHTLEALDLIERETTNTFLQKIVAFTFEQGQAHWAEKAAQWLEEGLPVNEQVANAVDKMVSEKRASQQARHRAFRAVARWRREGVA